ncbi:MAG: baseplate wedge protein 53 [Pelagibacteraceae bacterium]
MGYFKELPDLDYQSFLSDSISSQSYVRVKNLFRRNKLRDDLKGVFTLFNKYEIVDGARPDTVAEEFYGDAELDWVVLMTAGIINVRDEWPLSNYNLYRYAENKYGSRLNDIHHYETVEVRDPDGKLILPAKKIVPSDFQIHYYYNNKYYTNNSMVLGNNVVKIDNPIVGVSNYEYESAKNDKKSSIYLLKTSYLQQFLNDMRQIMIYDRSSQYIDESLIRTENTRITMP